MPPGRGFVVRAAVCRVSVALSARVPSRRRCPASPNGGRFECVCACAHSLRDVVGLATAGVGAQRGRRRGQKWWISERTASTLSRERPLEFAHGSERASPYLACCSSPI